MHHPAAYSHLINLFAEDRAAELSGVPEGCHGCDHQSDCNLFGLLQQLHLSDRVSDHRVCGPHSQAKDQFDIIEGLWADKQEFV